jgi:hypothetical protein
LIASGSSRVDFRVRAPVNACALSSVADALARVVGWSFSRFITSV